MANARSFFEQLGLRRPIAVAPMAGGYTTPTLVGESCAAGALGAISGAYLTPDEITAFAADVRARTPAPFAINLFSGPAEDSAAAPALRAETDARLEAFRLELGLSPRPADGAPAPPIFAAQLEAVLRARPAVFSFTFGLPAPEHLAALRARSILTLGTATNVAEAEALDTAGVDAICAQGAEAGGHRGTFIGSFTSGLVGTMTLVQQILARVRVPVLAAGGIMDGRGIAAALMLGASGVQLGTAFLACPEAGTPLPFRDALRSRAARETVVTAAFTGRPARALRNRFTDAFAGQEVPGFAEHSARTRDLRAAARSQGRADLMQMLVGQGAPLARSLPARQLIEVLAEETEVALRSAAERSAR